MMSGRNPLWQDPRVLYGLISLLSVGEIRFLSHLLDPAERSGSGLWLVPQRGVLPTVLLFVLLYPCLRKQNLQRRERLSPFFLGCHALALGYVLVSGFYPDGVRAIEAWGLFAFFYLAFHATAVLSFFSCRKAYVAYAVAVLSFRLLSFKEWSLKLQSPFPWLNEWIGIMSLNTLHIVYFLLKGSGLRARWGFKAGVPYLGTDVFRTWVWPSCSGLEGITLFLGCFLLVVYFAWEKIDYRRACWFGMAGIAVMYAVNIVRVYVLILTGHFFGADRMLSIWHSHGAALLYALVLTIFLERGYRWMVPDSRSVNVV